MRVISPAEIRSLEADADIPYDLRFNYLPVDFRVFTTLNGEKTITAYDSDDYTRNPGRIADRTIEDLDAIRLMRRENGTDGKVFQRSLASDFEWHSFSFTEGSQRNRLHSQPALLPLDRLLFKKELSEIEIEPRPGYLYLGWRYLEESYSEYHTASVASHGRNFREWLYSAANELRCESQSISNKKSLRPSVAEEVNYRDQVLVAFEEGRSIELSDRKIEPWLGRANDILHATNSKIVFRRCVSTDPLIIDYVFETPLEMPPGFVRETADILKRKWRAASTLVERFVSLVFARSAPEIEIQSNYSNEETTTHFPHGEPKLVGPDHAWHECDDPSLVQTILLARLIGGNAWQYALGNLEMKMGRL